MDEMRGWSKLSRSSTLLLPSSPSPTDLASFRGINPLPRRRRGGGGGEDFLPNLLNPREGEREREGEGIVRKVPSVAAAAAFKKSG